MMLAKDALEIVLDPGPGFCSRLFLVEKATGGLVSRDRPLLPERVCSANSVQGGDHSLRATLCLGGGFPGFHQPEGRIYPDTRSSVVEEAIEVPVEGSSLPIQGPVLRTVDCSSDLLQCVCSGL